VFAGIERGGVADTSAGAGRDFPHGSIATAGATASAVVPTIAATG
jgi:hypothetical protein